MKSDDKTRSAHQSETTASSQEARVAQVSNQTNSVAKKKLTSKQAARYCEIIGTADQAFLEGLISQLGPVISGNDDLDENQLNFVVSIIGGVKSKARSEIMLAIELAVIHRAMMRSAQILETSESIAEIEIIGNIVTKLARTYASFMAVQQRHPRK